ncbi:FAD-dependent oxidoreductase [Thioclava sp. GXIMD2076]|uniref:NAD(P)/FAD-dependent oxidoreductase n=1 Tax=Thioclava sp. GXIMD2076 TaxID=3131931 RepID=UPI0030CD99D5
MTHHIIIGAGHAGMAAARELAKHGQVTVIDADPYLPYERPALSKEFLLADSFPDPQSHDWGAITFVGGTRVAEIRPDAHEIRLEDGRVLGYDRLLLTTGGTARALPVAGAEMILGLRDLGDARKLHGLLREALDIAIIGAGVIGLEVASTARKLGLGVHVIELGDRVMARSLPPEISDLLMARHRASGVQFHMGTGLDHLRTRDGRQILHLGDGSDLEVDQTLAGVGFTPDTGLAEAAGIACDHGIVVDGAGRTSAPDIFAAGDVSVFPDSQQSPSRWQTWQHAQRHGSHVARAMAGQSSDYMPLPWFWTDQQGINLQVLGSPLRADHCVLRGAPEGPSTRIYLRDGQIAGAVMIDQGRDTRPLTALIESGASPDPVALADPATPLRNLIPARSAA